MPDEDEHDAVTLLCTCGSFGSQPQVRSEDDDDDDKNNGTPLSPSSSKRTRPRPTRATTTTTMWLESSFVHLMAPRHRRGPLHEEQLGQKASYYPQNNGRHLSPHGFLEQYQHMEQLLMAAASSSSSTAATTTTTPAASVMANIPLCSDCIDRVAAALEEDTHRLHDETRAYKEWVMDRTQSLKTMESAAALSSTGNHSYPHQSPFHPPKLIPWLHQTEQAYQEEISMLQQEVQARESELFHLHSLYKEQLAITEELEEFANQVHQDQNSLELQAKAFDDSAMLLSKSLSTIQTEVDQLSIVRLPLSLFDLQVDERGLRYPLINQLRWAFRPKGDVTDSEIRAAWSHATQLLWVVGTLLHYTSSEWKLAPLAVDCAKLIYRKEIFNLKPGDCRSLMAWNALLDQVIRHAKTIIIPQPLVEGGTATKDHPNKSSSPPLLSPPFPSSPSSIGTTELARLDRADHVSWSQVVHRMASNLLWLSERVAEHVALQVSTLAHSVE